MILLEFITPIYFTSKTPHLMEKPHEIRWFFPALKLRKHFLPQPCLKGQIPFQGVTGATPKIRSPFHFE